MRTPPEQLPDGPFDLIIIGAGIHGLFLAWIAARAGVRVAVLERADIGTGATANSLRIVHGGLRYLQRLDIPRMRRSMQARRWFLQAVPELVEPLECAVPAGGSLKRSSLALRLGFHVNDLICADANRGLRPERRLPRSRVRKRIALPDSRLQPVNSYQSTGHWWDARLVAPGRLCVELARAAVKAGAALCTYSAATEFLVRDGQIQGVRARNTLTGTEVEIPGNLVLDTSGAAGRPLRRGLIEEAIEPGWVGAANVLLRHTASTRAAIGLRAPEGGRAGAPMRDYFFVPLAGRLSAGTTYIRIDDAETEEQAVDRAVSQLLGELNAASPALALKHDDVLEVFWGRLPALADHSRPASLSLQEHGTVMPGTVQGYWLVTATKFTTAPIEALHTLRSIRHLLPLQAPLEIPDSLTSTNLTSRISERNWLTELHSQGSCNNPEDWTGALRRAFMEEGAVSLDDALQRRLELLPCEFPEATVLARMSRQAAAIMGWTEQERRKQLHHVIQIRTQNPIYRAAHHG